MVGMELREKVSTYVIERIGGLYRWLSVRLGESSLSLLLGLSLFTE